MRLKTYTLSVSLAAIIGLLVTIAPLIRNVLEYRSPSPRITEPHELSSVELFIAVRADKTEAFHALHGDNETFQQWKGMYDAAKAQYVEATRQQVESIRSKAAHNIAAYGVLSGLCIVLLITHLLWARRLSSL